MPAGAPRTRLTLYASHLLAIPGLALSNILLGISVLALPRVGVARPALPRSLRPLAWTAGAYLALLAASILASRDVATSARAISEVFSFATLALALVWLRGARPARWLVDLLILLGAATALWGLAQLAFGYGDLDRRIRGPFSHYMTFAGWLLPLDLMLIARALLRQPEEGEAAGGVSSWLDRPAVTWTALAAINLAMIGSLTRSAWLGLAAALALVGALVRPRLLAWALPVGLFLLLLAPVPVVARAMSITDLTDESNYDRLCMVEAGLRMIGERPLLGIGPDRVERRYPLYRHPSAPRRTTPHLHNAYLELAAERGLLSLAAFLYLIALAARRAYVGLAEWRGGGGGPADLHLGVLGALAAFAVAALFENNWGDAEVQRVILMLVALPFVATLEPESA
ncbi:MAG: O-antigen ligase family protein [Acidobacteria bacterium]|nr:O-antigen ligase family protein [Acidobacteriota bacterium]